MKHVAVKETLTQKKQKVSTQLVMKIPTAFMTRFDRIAEELGYTRTEAVKEAMRRFEEWGERRLMGRPEIAASNMKQMMESIFKPLFEAADKYEKSEKNNVEEIVEIKE